MNLMKTNHSQPIFNGAAIVKGNYTNVEIYRFLEHISHTVGETITEYHWREVCELMKLMEDGKMVKVAKM